MVRRASTRRFDLFFPDAGPLRRELYQKHLEFFRAGAKYRERCAMCANRVGKTEGMGGYELTCHLTGYYPPWWEGRRLTEPEYEAERVSIVTLRTAFYERARCIHSDPAPGAAQTPKTEKRTGEPLAAVAGVTA